MDFQQKDLINARERFNPIKKDLAPKVDLQVSKIVGKTILINDPRLIRLIAKWKMSKKGDDNTPDNFLSDPKKVEELKKTFNSNL
jgi:hypothetical protein